MFYVARLPHGTNTLVYVVDFIQEDHNTGQEKTR